MSLVYLERPGRQPYTEFLRHQSTPTRNLYEIELNYNHWWCVAWVVIAF